MINVLILSPDPGSQGGVVNFNELLKTRFSDAVKAEYFTIGSRPGRDGGARKYIQPLMDAYNLNVKLGTIPFDVVHLNPSLNRKSVLRDSLFLLVLRARGIRAVLVFIRGWNADYVEKVMNSTLRRRFFRWVFGGAKRILVLASRFREELLSMGFEEERITLFSTMFDGSQLGCSRKRKGIDEINILFLSRFVTEKGIYELLEGFSELINEYPSARLIMAGGGPEEENAVRWVREHNLTNSIDFPGYLKGNAKADVLLQSDLFILPTYYGEGCPNAILEAMGAGLPIITTHAGGIPDVVVDGVNGILLSAVTGDAIAAAIRDLLSDSELCERISRENKKLAWENYESVVVTRRLENIYRELIL